MTGRNMITAALAVYGPRTSVIIYNVGNKTLEVYELKLTEDNKEKWEQSSHKITL